MKIIWKRDDMIGGLFGCLVLIIIFCKCFFWCNRILVIHFVYCGRAYWFGLVWFEV